MTFALKLDGLAGLQAQLLDLGDTKLGVKALASAARQAFKPVLEAARALVPVDTGELRDALRLTVLKPKGGDAVVVVGLRIGSGTKGSKKLPPARRWHWVELGTVHMAAHPFLRPALDQNAQGVLDALKDEIAKSIAKIQRKAGK